MDRQPNGRADSRQRGTPSRVENQPHAILWHILWGVLKPGVVVKWVRGHATLEQARAWGWSRVQWDSFRTADHLATSTRRNQGPNDISIGYLTHRI